MIYWELVEKTKENGDLKEEMILVCNALRNDLMHPNEYVRGLTLRLLCRIQKRTIWQSYWKCKIQQNSKKKQKLEFFKVNQKIKKYSKNIRKYGGTPYFWNVFEYCLIFGLPWKIQVVDFFLNFVGFYIFNSYAIRFFSELKGSNTVH